MIKDSIKKYDVDFFKQFASNSRETQKSLEEYILKLSNEDAEMLIIAMINQAYSLNQFIPNIELVLYKIFFSPITTEEERAGNSDLLAGNIFG